MTVKFCRFSVVGLALLGIVFLCGPRPSVDSELRPVRLPASLDELQTHLALSESAYRDHLIPGTEKTIRFLHDDRRKTDFAVVHVHGFSASRQDCHPVVDLVAEHLQANVFYTRLTAHGLRDEEFADVTANDWLNDVNEAVEIGKRLGERVVLTGHSTGATLALWRASLGDPEIDAIVLLSPNFGVAHKQARFALYPWGQQIARVLAGPYAGFEPQNQQHALYWTERYRTDGVVQLLALVQFCCERDYTNFKPRSLCVYSEEDAVVSLDRMKEKWSEIDPPGNYFHALSNSPGHGLAGDILSPETTVPLVQLIVDFLDETAAAVPEHRSENE